MLAFRLSQASLGESKHANATLALKPSLGTAPRPRSWYIRFGKIGVRSCEAIPIDTVGLTPSERHRWFVVESIEDALCRNLFRAVRTESDGEDHELRPSPS